MFIINRKATFFILFVLLACIVFVWQQMDREYSYEEPPPSMVEYEGETYISEDVYFQTNGHPVAHLQDTGNKAGDDSGPLANGRILEHKKTGDLYIEDKRTDPVRWILYKKRK
ncbi:hypothetical protein [Desmospora profundinema]|uniref:Uncharacterized protein n=1 Tax=Desmospora profundinema TaxID=1571184 RepID=A0ABU1IJN3_9BACL|nr:hypothetical protein [Desmospora profundinema]MDR6224968.1 hypothetical protein [Desmospora profundinema]